MKYPLAQALADARLTRAQVAAATGLTVRTVHTDLSTARAIGDRSLAAYAGLLGVSVDEARQMSPAPRRIAAHRLLRERGRSATSLAADHRLNAAALRAVLLGLRPAGPRASAALEAELGLPAEVLTQPDDGSL